MADSDMRLSNLDRKLNITGFKFGPSNDSLLSWEVACGGLCLIILIIVILWLVWRWMKTRREMAQNK